MDNIRYYLSIFLRRLPYFLVVATVLSAVAVTVALSLPPSYVSQMRLVVESPQIPEELAASTVRTPALEQLQIIEQRLLTRANLLDIARRLDVLPNAAQMNPDQVVGAMRARTTIRTSSGRDQATLMTVSFEAPDPRKAAGVLNEYLTLIQQEDTQFRQGRAGETKSFFQQEVDRLSEELDAQSARILKYKQDNTGALPDSLDFRMNQHADLQDRLSQVERDITDLKNQRDRLVQLYQITGDVQDTPEQSLSPEERQLRDLNSQLNEALVVYSPENPRVKLLKARIARLEDSIAPADPAEEAAVEPPAGAPSNASPMLDVQLSEIDGRVQALETQRSRLETQIDALNDSIGKTPEVSIALDELNRKYDSLQAQYNAAEDRLAQASTGDRIETRSRGQRISVIEQPAIPSEPTKPNRIKIAGGGSFLGVAAGIGLILLLEFLNTSARRPEDLVARFGITPLTTIPYVRTRRQMVVQRGLKLLLSLAILIGIPAAIYAVHVYYLPLDLIADKVMNKIGVRW